MQTGYIKINLTKVVVILFVLKVLLDNQNQNLLVVPAFFDYFCIAFGISIFLMKIIPYHFTLKSFFLFLGSALFVLLTCYQIKQYNLLISFITIILLKDENLDEYISLIFKWQNIMMIIIFCILSIYHWGYFEYFYWFRQDGRIRFTGCMAHPNVLSGYILSAMLMYVWLNFHNMTTKKYVYLILVSCISYALTDTRTTFILSIFFIIVLYFGKSQAVQNLYRNYLKFMFPALGGIVWFLITNYTKGNAVILMIDKLVSGRIKLGAYAYEHSGLSIFPRLLEYAQSGVVQWEKKWGLNTFTFDNIYSFVWVQLGVLWFIFISYIIYIWIKKTDYKCHVFILMWIIYGFTEVHGINCFRFFPMLLVTLALKDTEKIKAG